LRAWGPRGFKSLEFLSPYKISMHMIVTLLFHVYYIICSICPYFYSMVTFCMLFANIHHHACQSNLLSIITCQRKRSVLPIPCTAQFHAGVLWTTVLSFVLEQDTYKSVLSSSVVQTAIATVTLSVVADQVIGQSYSVPVKL
jgi:hypothetical protein